MTPRRHLVVFAKAPRRGAAKTRLARDIGRAAAWRFARDMARDLPRRLGGDGRWRLLVAVTPDRFAREGRFWPPGAMRVPQGRGDLGARMARALRRLPPGPAVAVGSDVPEIAPRHIVAAFRALGANDAVFGPSPDGGYWLIGLRRRPAPSAFRGVAWSTERALAETLATLPRNARVGYLEALEDIDDGESWSRWRSCAPSSRSRRRGMSSTKLQGLCR